MSDLISIKEMEGVPVLVKEYFERTSYSVTTPDKVDLTTGFFFFSFSGVAILVRGRLAISVPKSNNDTLYTLVIDGNHWFGGVTISGAPAPFFYY